MEPMAMSESEDEVPGASDDLWPPWPVAPRCRSSRTRTTRISFPAIELHVTTRPSQRWLSPRPARKTSLQNSPVRRPRGERRRLTAAGPARPNDEPLRPAERAGNRTRWIRHHQAADRMRTAASTGRTNGYGGHLGRAGQGTARADRRRIDGLQEGSRRDGWRPREGRRAAPGAWRGPGGPEKAGRDAREGLVGTYIHTGGTIRALIEVNCETDFVARTDQFQQLVKDLAMQIVALKPLYPTIESIPAEALDGQARRAAGR